jgi:hypothetical protein
MDQTTLAFVHTTSTALNPFACKRGVRTAAREPSVLPSCFFLPCLLPRTNSLADAGAAAHNCLAPL